MKSKASCGDEGLIIGAAIGLGAYGGMVGLHLHVVAVLVKFRDRLRRMIHARMDPRLAARLDASDVVQEIIVQLWRSRRRYDGSSRQSTWIPASR